MNQFHIVDTPQIGPLYKLQGTGSVMSRAVSLGKEFRTGLIAERAQLLAFFLLAPPGFIPLWSIFQNRGVPCLPISEKALQLSGKGRLQTAK